MFAIEGNSDAICSSESFTAGAITGQRGLSNRPGSLEEIWRAHRI
jgi:hypothetical protein